MKKYYCENNDCNNKINYSTFMKHRKLDSQAKCMCCSHKKEIKIKENYCLDCDENIGLNAKRCGSCAQKKRLENSKNHPFYGKHHTEEIKLKLRILNLGKNSPKYIDGRSYKKRYCVDCDKLLNNTIALRCKKCCKKQELHPQYRDKHWNWRGGVTFEKYGVEFNNFLREEIRNRDKYICQICGCFQLENGRQLDVHHIDYNKKNNDENNLISLCKSCHGKTNKNRRQWQIIIKNIRKVYLKINF